MSQNKNPRGINVWSAIRDVLIHSMNKGQLPLLAVAAIVALIIWKLPPEALERIVTGILSEKLLVISVPLNVVLTIGWWYNARWLRKKASTELARVGMEKSGLQEQVHQQKLSSSAKNSHH